MLRPSALIFIPGVKGVLIGPFAFNVFQGRPALRGHTQSSRDIQHLHHWTPVLGRSLLLYPHSHIKAQAHMAAHGSTNPLRSEGWHV